MLKPIRFGDYLLERALVTEAQLLDALADHWVSGRRIGDAIARRGYLDKDAVERYAHEYQSLETVYV